MRDLALVAVLVPLLAMAAARPFVGVLIWSWISFMNPHREVYGFASTMPWAIVTFAVTGFGCMVAHEPRKPALNGVTVLLLVLIPCITITSLTALGPSTAVWEKWDKIIKIIIGLQLTASMLTSRQRIHALVWLMVISIGYFSVKGGLFTLRTGGAFIVRGPAQTMIEDRNHLAVAMLVALPLMNYLRQQSRHKIVRWGLITAMAFTLFAVVGSQSRGALVALVATLFVLWLRSRGKVASGLVIAAGVGLAILFMPDTWVQRMHTIRDFEADGSAMGRLTIWRAAALLALMRPLVGSGFQGFYNQSVVDIVDPSIKARASHSIWMEVLGEHGFPTFFVWLGILGFGTAYTFSITRRAAGRPDLAWAYDLARMMQVSITAYCSGGTFLSLSYWDFFWTLLVVAGATRALVLQAHAEPRAAAGTTVTQGWRRQRRAPAAARALAADSRATS